MPVHKQTHRTTQKTRRTSRRKRHSEKAISEKLVGMPTQLIPKNSTHKLFLYKLVLYHVPTQKPIDATLSPLSILKNSKLKNLKVDISHEK